MKTISLLLVISIFAVVDKSSIANEASIQVESLKLGIFPRRGAVTTDKMFQPLVQSLSEQLNITISLETTHDFASFWQKVAKQEYDIVHFNQYHYVKSHAKYGYQVIVQNVELGHDTIAGAILVRRDSQINSLQDLKGKKIVFGGGRGAMQAYITATYLLRLAGLKQGDYFEHFALNPPKASIATYYRQATAAGAGNYVLDLPFVKKQINTDEMKYLAVSQPMAHLPWAVKQSMPKKQMIQLKEAMIDLVNSKKGKDILKAARIDKFLPVTDRDYRPHREIINKVLAENYFP